MPDQKDWDVFLSYASADRTDVEKLALRLEDEAQLKVFLDKWRLVPGQLFPKELDKAIHASQSCAVFIGREGIRPWHNEEMQWALDRAVSRSHQAGGSAFQVIPVLLPGANQLTEDDIPSFIRARTWVDFRSAKGLDDPDAFHLLVTGIRGLAPGKPRVPPAWLTTIRVPELARPTGLAVDRQAIVVADHEAGHIIRVENGEVVHRAAGLLKPHHLILRGDMVVATDTDHHKLVFFDLDLSRRRAKGSLGEYRLRRPHGLTSNYPDEFYLTDADNHRVLRVENGKVTAAIGRPGCRSGFELGEFSIPCGVAASLDCIYVADTFNHRVQVLTRDLRALSSFGRLGHGMGEFAYPVAVAAWHQWIVIADEHNKRLQLWQREGQGGSFTATCISADLCGAWLGSPFGLTFDEDGRLFVADRKGGQLLQIDFEKMLAGLSGRKAGAAA